MGVRHRRGGLIPRALAWARTRGRAGPAPAPAPAESARELEDRLELARRRLKQNVPPRGES